MKMSRVQAVLVVLVIVLAAGCSREPDAKDAQADVDKSRSGVREEVKNAAQALTAGGWQVSGLSGSFVTCGSGGLGAATIMYSAGGTVRGGDGTRSERIVAATKTLEAAGWKVRKDGTSSGGEAYSRLTRDGMEVAIDPDQLIGSQDFGFGVNGECVQVTDEQANYPPEDEPISP